MDAFFGIPERSSSSAVKRYDEEKGEYSIFVEAPGFSKDEINVELENGRIVIDGEIKNEEVKNKIGAKSFRFVEYQRDIDKKSLNASLKDGILTITFKLSTTPSKKVEIKYLT
jgi:HSP20 family protein